MHDLIVQVGETITLLPRSFIAVKLMASNGRSARLLTDVPDSNLIRQVESQRKFLEQPMPADSGEKT